jgi:hypothetical protein
MERKVTNYVWLGLGFVMRCGSRILRFLDTKKPDVVGLFG